MIRNVLTHIGGVEIYGIVSIVLFFVFFVGMLIWASRLRRDQLEAISRLPLENDDPSRGVAPTFNRDSEDE